ncbi:hypothetical protein EYC87_05315 [Halieaceae bacterium IMCC8485]|uniref:Nicotinamide riboside transporter PnuC n=1 Tax=Candidatus Seongchinamella marina TaxID=2518990 RepID=A0ABT3SSN2_9GAMM|nr:hypothetical protein [Candidatus Seongchinamella marina]MCX2973003.1 hypothetical protein [Candidatus Seongchinamella marina]
MDTTTDTVELAEQHDEALDKALGRIKNGWIAAIISMVMTLAISLYAASTGGMVFEYYNAWMLIDVVLIAAMAWGIYKKNRAAATTMFVYFIASKMMLITETGRMQGALMSFVMLWFYFQAMVGTFQYHKLTKKV